MEPPSNNEIDFERYLLGDLTEDQLADAEVSLADDRAYERFLLAEQNLIDRYLGDELNSHDRRLFEENYLDESPHRWEKVAKAKAIFTVLPTVAESPDLEPALNEQHWFAAMAGSLKRGATTIGYVLAGLIVVSLGTLAYIMSRQSGLLAEQSERTRQQLEETTQQRDKEITDLRGTVEQLKRERDDLAKREAELNARLEGQQQNQSIFAAVLSPFGLVKGTDEEKLHSIPSNTRVVRLSLQLRSGVSYDSYRVLLNGRMIGETLRTRRISIGEVVVVQLSPRQLNEGTNSIELLGKSSSQAYEKVDGYSIQIDKK